MNTSSSVPGQQLSDYQIDSRVVYVSALAAVLGAISTLAAWALLRLIAIATNAFYFQRFSFADVEPATRGVHWWMALMPIAGGLIVGLIARYGSPKVRGHGMPEAVEVVVFNGGRVQPRVALLKPLATAISIGSGGPFGAEGPIIMTGGAVGSVLGQILPMTDTERAVLMVAGASAGMAATFNCPMSAVLLAVELLLFEWRPRSLVPVAIACVTAGSVRHLLLGSLPIFPMQPTTGNMNRSAMLAALAVGIVAALLATGLSKGILLSEHFFEEKLKRIHWMWWPAIGGIVVGLGGLVFPQALGVGYGVIEQLVVGDFGWKLLAGVLIVKSIIWMFSLGSNTAGGILAPLLMIGGAMGAAMGHWMPFISPGAWAVVGMTAVLSAAIGSPLTAAMLAVELTHNGGLMLPVLLACVCAYGISILIQPRSMLTASLSRRGLHLTREYGIDPLELVMVSAVMHTSVFALPIDARRKQAIDWLAHMNERGHAAWSHWQRIFPLVSPEGHLGGILTRSQMIVAAEAGEPEKCLIDDGAAHPITLSTMQTLRQAAMVMAETKHTAFPVVDPAGKFAGIVTIADLLQARTMADHREHDRQRVLRVRWPFRQGQQEPVAEQAAAAIVDELDGIPTHQD
jgi:H+/Cl- antiporter ClcA